MVAPVTTRIRRIRAEVALGPEDGVPRPSVVNLDSIEAIPIASLRERITMLREEKLGEIEATIHYTLDLQSCRPS
jgi:mRNA-degrading endonuclease toxin of MazEF toxin-antitoxin module